MTKSKNLVWGLVLGGSLSLALAACGGGGGGGGGSGSTSADRPLRITALSETSTTPFGLITVTGQGFDTTAETFVQFTSAVGSYAVSVPAVGVTATSVMAAVPPYFDSEGHLGSGTVGVRLLQKAGGEEIQSPQWDGFQILALPATGLPPGTVTLDFAQAVAGLAGDLETQITETTLDTAGVRAGLAQLRQAYGDLADQVRAVMEGSAQSLTLGTLGGTSLTIGLPQLADADRMMVAIVGQVGDAQLGRIVNPAAVLRQSPRLLALTTPTEDYMDCMVQLTQSPDGVSTCSGQRIRLVTWSVPEAFKRAYQVIVGSGSVVLGTLTLGGVPAAATALPAAALSYVQMVGGSGLIAVGGALQQSTAEARGIVQQGVATFNAFLTGVAETFLTTFVPATEELVAVKNILEGGSDLFDAFGAADLNPGTPNDGTGAATYSTSFTGTTVEVSSFATLTYEVIGAVTTTLEGGAGTMIDPYRGTLVVEGTLFIDCAPNLPDVTCENASAPFRIEGPVEGSAGKVQGWAGGDSADQSPAVFQGGVLSGNELSGEFSFDVGCYWACADPIAKTITLLRMP
jgi:hypothetical protein